MDIEKGQNGGRDDRKGGRDTADRAAHNDRDEVHDSVGGGKGNDEDPGVIGSGGDRGMGVFVADSEVVRMRIIDAEELKRRVEHEPDMQDLPVRFLEIMDDMDEVVQLMSDKTLVVCHDPAEVERVQVLNEDDARVFFPSPYLLERVVRCRECVMWDGSFTLNGQKKCLNMTFCTDGDFYCGWGSKE